MHMNMEHFLLFPVSMTIKDMYTDLDIFISRLEGNL
jgi:hypothetical protein